MQVWDTAGGVGTLERLGASFWCKAAAFLFIFSVGDAHSFGALDQLRSLLQDEACKTLRLTCNATGCSRPCFFCKAQRDYPAILTRSDAVASVRCKPLITFNRARRRMRQMPRMACQRPDQRSCWEPASPQTPAAPARQALTIPQCLAHYMCRFLRRDPSRYKSPEAAPQPHLTCLPCRRSQSSRLRHGAMPVEPCMWKCETTATWLPWTWPLICWCARASAPCRAVRCNMPGAAPTSSFVTALCARAHLDFGLHVSAFCVSACPCPKWLHLGLGYTLLHVSLVAQTLGLRYGMTKDTSIPQHHCRPNSTDKKCQTMSLRTYSQSFPYPHFGFTAVIRLNLMVPCSAATDFG